VTIATGFRVGGEKKKLLAVGNTGPLDGDLVNKSGKSLRETLRRERFLPNKDQWKKKKG